MKINIRTLNTAVLLRSGRGLGMASIFKHSVYSSRRCGTILIEINVVFFILLQTGCESLCR